MTARSDNVNDELGEERIIAEYFAPLSQDWPGAFQLADDCAVVTPAPGQDLIVKTDPIRAGVHFFPDDRPQDIAWKALAVNVSDLAAKAARPIAYMLAVSFPQAPDRDWLAAFAEGLSAAQEAFGCHLIGGDTDHAPGPLSIAVTVFGEAPAGRMIRRATPSPGDLIFVSGSLGDAALGLMFRGRQADDESVPDPMQQARTALIARYLRPSPRLGLRAALRAYASAAMDISDGLGKDLGRMCRASGLGAVIEEERLPLSDAFHSAAPTSTEARRKLITSGDDYEILCTVNPAYGAAFAQLANAGGIKVSEIGSIAPEGGARLIDQSGNSHDWSAKGYDHFR